MVRRLLPRFNLAQLHMGFRRRVMQHFHKQFFFHKMRAAAGGQISAPGQQLHGFHVDVFVTCSGVSHRLAALGKGRRIQNDKIVVPTVFRLQFVQQCKHIGLHYLHPVRHAVLFRVQRCHPAGLAAHIHCCHMSRSAFGRIQGKTSGMSETVQHVFAFRNTSHTLPVIFLIQKEPRLLPVLHIYLVHNTVFTNRSHRRCGWNFAFQRKPAFSLFQSFQQADFYIVPLIHAGNGFTIFSQQLNQQRDQHMFALFHSQG